MALTKTEWDQEYIEATCDHCGKLRRVIEAKDPFTDELYPDLPNTESFWCYECFMERRRDT